MMGNLPKCRDCVYFRKMTAAEKKNTPERYLDGICEKVFPRGYAAKEPPHKVWNNDHACFQFLQGVMLK